MQVQRIERAAIVRVLEQQRGNLSQTALSLGIDRNTLKRKLAALAISPRKRGSAGS